MPRKQGAEGFAEVAAQFQAMAGRVANLQPVLAVKAREVKAFIDERFDSGTDPSGNAWAPLAPSTLARRGEGAQILVDTGRLRRSVIIRPTRQDLQIKVQAFYGKYHQSGTSKMPARPFLPFPSMGGPAAELWRKVFNDVREYIRTGRVR